MSTKTLLILTGLYAAFAFSFLGGAIYVGLHFLLKIW